MKIIAKPIDVIETAGPVDEKFAVAINMGIPPAGGLGIMIMYLKEVYSDKDYI